MLANILLCVLGTLGFCSILNAPIKKIPLILIGAFISASVFELLFQYNSNLFISTAVASCSIGLYSEGIARLVKTPSTVILLPSTIPLLPGGSLYYTMSSIVNSDFNSFAKYGLETIYIGFGIAFGLVITSIIMRLILNRHQQ